MSIDRFSWSRLFHRLKFLVFVFRFKFFHAKDKLRKFCTKQLSSECINMCVCVSSCKNVVSNFAIHECVHIHIYRQNKWKNRYVPAGADDDSCVDVAADCVASAIVVKCHKLVVCTRPRSKLKHSSTAAPTDVRRKNIDDTFVHSSACGSYFSTVFKDDAPSLPPNTYK